MQGSYIACYDISCAQIRKRARHELLNISHARQYSVFECQLNMAQAAQLQQTVASLLEPGDSFLLFKTRATPAIRLGASAFTMLDIGYVG